MQPDGPYRYTHLLGGSPVGKAWAAVDGQGRFVTVAVLDTAVAASPGWREAFAGIANNLAQTPGGPPFTYADFSAAAPWVAYSAEAGPAAEKLFRALGVDYQPVPTPAAPVSDPPQPVSGGPQQVSGPPQPVSGAPQPTSGAPHPVSGASQPTSGASQPPTSPIPSQPVYADPVSGAPTSPGFGSSFEEPARDPFTAPARRIQPSAPPKRRTGLWVSLAALVVVAALGSGVTVWALTGDDPEGPQAPPTLGAPSGSVATAAPVNPGMRPWAQVAPYSAEERALAIAAPSLVFVETVVTGVLRETKSNTPLSATPVTFKRRCSGFVVNPDGHVVTNGQCVQPTADAARERALYTLGRILVEQKQLAGGELDQYVRTRMATTVFTGDEPGSEPTTQLYGQLNVARGDLTASPAVPGQVVRVLPADDGNLALVKLAEGGLPAVQLSEAAAPEQGSTLLVLGYRTTDTDFRAATYTAEARAVQVSGTARQGGVTAARINDDLGIYSHGGIGVDTNGHVVGVLDNDRAANGGANRALLPVSVVTDLLSAAGTSNELGAADRTYRSGLDAFFGGRNSEAIARFDEVAQSSPSNLVAQAYRQNAIDRSRLEGGSSESSNWPTILLAGLAGAVLVGLAVGAVALLRRRR
ncbi:trypsin-like peptidase domain-containing protein [Micromonospora sp. NPDC049903]|uniref:trypsin-like peptidase domain-containing protein n=1 Tax=Micromonospora sp. NPDC049903 TaxID=3364276 RepID=UPI0037989A29